VTVRAVLFDLDGTLLDSLADIGASMNAALAEHGFPEHPIAAYKSMVGDGVTVLARRALPETQCDEQTIAACVHAMRRVYALRWHVETRAYEGIHALIDELRRRGLLLAVLSNKPHDFTRAVVEHYFGLSRFTSVVGERAGIPAKPDPSSALTIAREAGVAPGEVLYVGDTDTDMRTAVAAGMLPIGAAWGFRPVEELAASGARAIAATPADVLRFLDDAS
jgi:phosphoglycolate phosphatase